MCEHPGQSLHLHSLTVCASVQRTPIPSAISTLTQPDCCLCVCAVQLTVLGHQCTLYSHVHHSYGLNDAFDRSVVLLLTAKQNLSPNSSAAAALESSVHSKPLDQEATTSQVNGTDDSPKTSARSLQTYKDSFHPFDKTRVTSSVQPVVWRRVSTQQQRVDSISNNNHNNININSNSNINSDSDSALPEVLGSRGEVSTSIEAPPVAAKTGNREVLSSTSHHGKDVGLVTGRQRSLLQDKVTLDHPCLHKGYVRDYTWVAHGAHVTPLPEVQLIARSAQHAVNRLLSINICLAALAGLLPAFLPCICLVDTGCESTFQNTSLPGQQS